MRLVSQISQQVSVPYLSQEIVQAIGTTVSTTFPRASFPECLEQREGERLVEDDQGPGNTFVVRFQRIKKRRFPFNDPSVSDNMMHEVFTTPPRKINRLHNLQRNKLGPVLL